MSSVLAELVGSGQPQAVWCTAGVSSLAEVTVWQSGGELVFWNATCLGSNPGCATE